jgi:hypothetical protein
MKRIATVGESSEHFASSATVNAAVLTDLDADQIHG